MNPEIEHPLNGIYRIPAKPKPGDGFSEFSLTVTDVEGVNARLTGSYTACPGSLTPFPLIGGTVRQAAAGLFMIAFVLQGSIRVDGTPSDQPFVDGFVGLGYVSMDTQKVESILSNISSYTGLQAYSIQNRTYYRVPSSLPCPNVPSP